jgi:hypothetical protein
MPDRAAGPPAVVTIAALYGTGGRAIGPQVGERLGVKFLDRVIPTAVAARGGVPDVAVAAVEGQRTSRCSSPEALPAC